MGWEVLGSIGHAAAWANDKINQTEDAAGKAIDGAVHTAEHAIDDARHAVDDFGERHGGSVGKYVAHQLTDTVGAAEGVVLGAYDAGKGVVSLARGAGHLVNPIDWAAHGDENMARLTATGNALTTMGKLGNPVEWAVNPKGNAQIAGAMWNGVTAGYQDAAKSGDWSKVGGRAVFDIGSFFIGAGEVNAGIKVTEGANALAHGAEAVNAIEHGAQAVSAIEHGAQAVSGAEHAAEGAAVLSRAAPEAQALTQVAAAQGRNTVTWTVNAEGNTVRAEAHLEEVFSGAPRSSAERGAQSAAGAAGETSDVGGHIIGHRFVKDQGSVNLFPQNSQFNNSAYRTLENEWGAWVDHGKQVDVSVELRGGTGARPDEVVVSYTVTDPATHEIVHQDFARLRNEAGQAFDRVPRADMK